MRDSCQAKDHCSRQCFNICKRETRHQDSFQPCHDIHTRVLLDDLSAQVKVWAEMYSSPGCVKKITMSNLQHFKLTVRKCKIFPKQTVPFSDKHMVLRPPSLQCFFPFLIMFFFPSIPFTLHVYPSSLPGSRGALRPTYQTPVPASPGPPLLSTSSRGGEARLKSPLSLPSDCLSLSSARRFLLLQMDDWSG